MVNFTCGTNRVITATCIHIFSARLFTRYFRIQNLNFDDAFFDQIDIDIFGARIATNITSDWKQKKIS